MKEEFLALVEKVTATGIADALCKAATVDERVRLWVKFDEENQDLFKEIVSWSVEFNKNACDPIFKKGEKIQNPLEIAVCISISGTAADDIFEEWKDFQSAIRNLDSEYALKLADAMDQFWISGMKISDPSNERVKEEFLALVEKVKATGIADALCKATTVKERQTSWDQFLVTHSDLIKESESWGQNYIHKYDKPLFKKGEKIENPLESSICCHISNILEGSIFEDWKYLRAEIRKLEN